LYSAGAFENRPLVSLKRVSLTNFGLVWNCAPVYRGMVSFTFVLYGSPIVVYPASPK
jgi:hypothetical protein